VLVIPWPQAAKYLVSVPAPSPSLRRVAAGARVARSRVAEMAARLTTATVLGQDRIA
jgi:hypothetical protein